MAHAKSIVKNKFWIVEQDGKQIATIQATNSGVVFVDSHKREKFNNLKMLSKKYNINFINNKHYTVKHIKSVYDYPCDVSPHNAIYDVKNKLPMYTKLPSSKCYYCAGYYLVLVEDNWSLEYCPKRIVLLRNKFIGPFKTSDNAKKFIEEGNLVN
jgi:hypothetical protein